LVSALATPITNKPPLKTAADWVHSISATLYPRPGSVAFDRRDETNLDTLPHTDKILELTFKSQESDYHIW